ncbi:MAG: LamG-like jellyroll fold domain-containing protein [Bacteroidota bacterium]
MNPTKISRTLLLMLLLSCITGRTLAQNFAATGYTKLEDIPANDWGGSEITFDKVPGAKLVIDGMGHALWQPADVRVNFGYLETYDPDRSNGDVLISWETIGDEAEKIYNRVWVENQNAARIKVMFIGGLIYLENNDTYGRRIAHSSYWSGSPWGPQYLAAHPDPEATGWGYGDWAEEVYYIYPDGTHTRYAKAYSAFAHVAQAFDTSRLPSEGDYQFEFMEAAFQIPQGQFPNTTVEPTNSVLLADMMGNTTQIDYEPENPGLVDVLNGFAPLRYGNMMAVNMVGSTHNPFIIGLPDSTELRPYECFTNDQDCSTFYMWGPPCTFGCVSPLGHLINWTQYEKQQADQASNTPGFVTNVFLQGWIDDATSGADFAQLGKSWIDPAPLNITSSGFTGGSYEITERAYKITKTTGTDFTCTLQGSVTHPIRNPAFVIEDWCTEVNSVTVDGVAPSDVRTGFEGDNLIVWIEHSAESAIDIVISNSNNPVTYTLTTNTTGGGSVAISPYNTLYDCGSVVTLTANPDSISTFTGWSGAASGTTNPLTITMFDDTDITANFFTCNANNWVQVNDNDVNASYSGTWTSVAAPNGYQNDAHFTQSSGATVTYSFTGTQVRLYLWIEQIAQSVNVSIDGSPFTNITQAGGGSGSSVQVYESPTLADGNHTLSVVYASGEVHIDAFEHLETCTISPPPPPPNNSSTFAAYYTRRNFDEYTSQISGEYADIVVKVDNLGELIFSREYSFRPVWSYAGGTDIVAHLASISGDGPANGNFDARCRFAYARIIKNEADQVIVHWRYFPNLNNLDPTAVVHELYYINSDGTVTREYKAGTATIDEWLDVNNKTTQTFDLTANGITNIQTNTGFYSPPGAITGNPILGAPAGSPVAHWTFDEAQGDNAAPNGIISGHKSLWKSGVSGTALGFDGYFSQVSVPTAQAPTLGESFTVDAWVVMGAYPFNNAPVVHHSENGGQAGYYLGINEAGQAIFLVNGTEVTTTTSLPLNQWIHLAGTYGNGSMEIYVDGVLSANTSALGAPIKPSSPLLMGLNNQVESPTDPVFEPQTYPSIFGLEGMIDEVILYNTKLSQNEINQNFNRLGNTGIKSSPDINLRVLPGASGTTANFGATHGRLSYHDLWDNMWRVSEFEDVIVKFENMPTSYVYWRGTTHGVNMVTENNLWMSDQSEEIFCGDLGYPPAPSGNPSLSEHMSDKEARYSHIRVIENTPARVVVHWRYAVADLFFDQCDDRNFVDEYHTIYPDGNLFRNLKFWTTGDEAVATDLQPLTAPGTLPSDIVNMQALSIANVDSSSSHLTWANGVPQGEDGILMVNFKSNWKVYQAFPAGFSAGPWGATNQSAQSTAPFAGPWNHWPVSRIVSDGRQAWDNDGRVNHFALSAGGGSSVVMYGFSNQGNLTTQDPTTVIPVVRAWQDSPSVVSISGGTSQGYNIDQREYNLTLNANSSNLNFTLAGSNSNPVVNPCFVIKNWNSNMAATIAINGSPSTNFKHGIIYDTDGTETLIIYVPMQSTSSNTFAIQSSVLPVNLLEFAAVAQPNHQSQLTWATASEQNNSHFFIERSPDGQSFTSIGRVEGAGTTTTRQEYIFFDEAPLEGTNYYRLQQVDFDGNFTFSNIELVEFRDKGKLTLTVFPNPTRHTLQYQIDAGVDDATLYLYDYLGRIVKTDRILSGQLDISDLPNGQYALVLVGNGQRVHQWVQKQ